MPTWFTGLFSGGFLNPGVAALGTLLISVPIIIHLINRLRYRRVEFAAMEFLLESEQQNRRRVLVEQLLLLLLRILAVALATLLIGRVVFDASQMSVLRGGVSNQIIVLDDSLSTSARAGDTSAFDRAKETAKRLIGAASEASGQQRVTVIRLSDPQANPATLTEQVIDGRTADEMMLAIDRMEPSAAAGDWSNALDAVSERIGTAEGSEKTTLLVISDAREQDWSTGVGGVGQSVATALQELDSEGVVISFVRTANESVDNLAITNVESVGGTTAAGVPMRVRATVTNYGEQPAVNVRVAISVDGRTIPQAIVFEAIEPGGEVSDAVSVVFEDPGPHRVKMSLPPDVLEADNDRFIAFDVPEEVGVLLVDGDPAGTDAQYIADALAADRSLTGFAPVIIGPAELGRTTLDRFQGIYLINVGDLATDVVSALSDYVSSGGGLVSFLGASSRPEFLNGPLVDAGLFPSPVAETTKELPAIDGAPDVVATEHPVFAILAGTDNPFLDQVIINQYWPLAGPVVSEPPAESVEAIASLRNGQPFVLDHRLGSGRVVTVLTAAGPGETGVDGRPTWNNWARSPSYPVFILELQTFVTAADVAGQTALVGESMPFRLDPTLYRGRVTVTAPNGDVSGVDAVADAESESGFLTASFDATGDPGVYSIVLEDAAGETETRTQALNVDPRESNLAVADDDAIRATLAGVSGLTIRDGLDLSWVEAAASGSSLRLLLVGLLLGLLVIEQWWASRLTHAGD